MSRDRESSFDPQVAVVSRERGKSVGNLPVKIIEYIVSWRPHVFQHKYMQQFFSCSAPFGTKTQSCLIGQVLPSHSPSTITTSMTPETLAILEEIEKIEHLRKTMITTLVDTEGVEKIPTGERLGTVILNHSASFNYRILFQRAGAFGRGDCSLFFLGKWTLPNEVLLSDSRPFHFSLLSHGFIQLRFTCTRQ